jgi:hypothetical protein
MSRYKINIEEYFRNRNQVQVKTLAKFCFRNFTWTKNGKSGWISIWE